VTASLVSLIVPALDERDNVEAMLARFGEIGAAHPDHDFELVLVDDGSTDGTAERFEELAPPDLRYAVVRLARNFGSHYAISAGFAEAAGDCAIVLGADLQEPPELIGRFLDEWHAGNEVVWGVRENRAKVSLPTRLFSHGFSRLFHRFADIKSYPEEGPSGVLCDRVVIDVLVQLPERNRNTYGLIAWLGFRQTRVGYTQLARNAGNTKWTRGRLLKLAIDSFIQFSTAPLKAMTWAGIGVASAGFVFALVLVVRGVVGERGPEGYTTLMVVVLVLGGLQLITLGALGAYLWRTVEETRGRPLFVLRDVRESAARRAPQDAP
jgi:dolichol-phosphate mannosyltransferase